MLPKAVTLGALPPLLRAIVQGDSRKAAGLVRMSPGAVTIISPGWAWWPKYRIGCSQGDTPLHLASRRTEVALVRQLLALSVDPNAANRHGHRPLHAAVSCSPEQGAPHHRRQAQVIALLVRAGADPDARDIRGVAPLHTAVRGRCLASVRALLDRGASLHARNNATGATPLHLAMRTTGRGGSGSPAARREQAAIIQLLLRRGARMSDRDRRGRSAAAWQPVARAGRDPV